MKSPIGTLIYDSAGIFCQAREETDGIRCLETARQIYYGFWVYLLDLYRVDNLIKAKDIDPDISVEGGRWVVIVELPKDISEGP